MKLFYIANSRIPTEKAHGIQIMKMCEALVDSGNEVKLVVPRRINNIKKSPFEYYSVKKNFKITKLPTLDLVCFGKIGFLIQTFSFLFFAKLCAIFNKNDIIYTREQFTGLFFKDYVLEIHSLPKKILWPHKKIWHRSKRIIVLTDFIKKELVKNGVDKNKILIAPDSVDFKKFNIAINKEEARKKLNLPQNKNIILYAGHLYKWKGAQILADAAKLLDENSLIVFVGGTEKDEKEFRANNQELENILVAGYQPHSEIPCWLKSADVLILPNSAKEYMASKQPIVASNLPSIREILNENNSVLVRPDNLESLANGIKKVLQDNDLAYKISKQAFNDVKNYTWRNRAKNILNFIKN